MSQTTTANTIAVLRRLFASYGLPEQIVSDNGPQFTSAEFVAFTQANGVKHLRCSPYHPLPMDWLKDLFGLSNRQWLQASMMDRHCSIAWPIFFYHIAPPLMQPQE